MKLTPQEEFGLRCLLRVAQEAGCGGDDPLTIERIADAEGLGYEHTAKIMRLLRRGDLVVSTRGAKGGYRLSRPAEEIPVWDALVALDPPLVGSEFCDAFSGRLPNCANSTGRCSLRVLWSWVDHTLQEGLRAITVADLIHGRLPVTAGAAK